MCHPPLTRKKNIKQIWNHHSAIIIYDKRRVWQAHIIHFDSFKKSKHSDHYSCCLYFYWNIYNFPFQSKSPLLTTTPFLATLPILTFFISPSHVTLFWEVPTPPKQCKQRATIWDANYFGISLLFHKRIRFPQQNLIISLPHYFNLTIFFRHSSF